MDKTTACSAVQNKLSRTDFGCCGIRQYFVRMLRSPCFTTAKGMDHYIFFQGRLLIILE